MKRTNWGALTGVVLIFIIARSLAAQGQELDKEVNLRKNGDDKQSFAGLMGAIGNFVGQNGNAITLQPTVYGLMSLVSPKLTHSKYYQKEVVARNFQLNVTLNTSSSIFKYDSIQLGFAYAIVNNKKLKASDYSDFNNIDAVKISYQLRDILARFLGEYKQDTVKNVFVIEKIRSLLNSTGTLKSNDLKSLPHEILIAMAASLKLTDTDDKNQKIIAKRLNAYDSVYNSLIASLTKRTLLTVEFNSIHNFISSQWQGFSFTPLNYYQYFFKRKWKKSPALNLKTSYLVSRDSAETQHFSKHTLSIDCGINFQIMLNEKQQPIFEIKPGVKYSNVINTGYEKEKKSKFKPTVTLRYKINNNFFLPLTIDYDPKNANFLGSLSVQYSLK